MPSASFATRSWRIFGSNDFWTAWIRSNYLVVSLPCHSLIAVRSPPKTRAPKKWTVSSKGAFHGWCFGCPWVLLFFGLRVQKSKQPLDGAGVSSSCLSSLSAEIPIVVKRYTNIRACRSNNPGFSGSFDLYGCLAGWHFGCPEWIPTVDGRNPQQMGCIYKTIVNNGINYQPQLVIAGFLNHQQDHVLLEWSLSFASSQSKWLLTSQNFFAILTLNRLYMPVTNHTSHHLDSSSTLSILSTTFSKQPGKNWRILGGAMHPNAHLQAFHFDPGVQPTSSAHHVLGSKNQTQRWFDTSDNKYKEDQQHVNNWIHRWFSNS